MSAHQTKQLTRSLYAELSGCITTLIVRNTP